MSELDKVTGALGREYKTWKKGEKEKNNNKTKFFELANAEVVERGLSRKVVTFEGESEGEARNRCLQYYPIFKVLDVDETEDGTWTFHLEELPEFKPFTHVNQEDGQVYRRIAQSGSYMVDLDRIKEEDPDLYESITEVPTERVLKSPDQMDDFEKARLQDYTYEEQPRMKLAPPKEAKDEESDDGQ